MSVEAMAVVLHHSKAKGTAKLVLVGIANHQGDGGAWPSVATLATYANVAPRNVQQAIRKLVGAGELSVRVQAGGLGDHDDYTRPNLYEVQVTCPPWCDRSMHHRDTRKLAGRQTSIPVSVPVDKPGDENVTGRRKHQGGGDESIRGGGDENVTQTVPTNPTVAKSSSQVQTARGRQRHDIGCLDPSHAGACRVERPPAPADPPADELSRVRDQLKRSTTDHHRRERGER